MRYLALLLVLFSCNAHAGFDEYRLLDTTDCKSYTVTNDIVVYPGKLQNEEADVDATIRKLKASHDDQWSEFGIYTENGNIYIGICKRKHDSSGRKFSSFQCEGDSRYPLPELRCNAGNGNQWYKKCSVKGKTNHDIRLYWMDTAEFWYWVDTAEYKQDVSPDLNEGYVQDIAKCKAKN